MAITVNALAKELGVSADEVLEQLQKLYVEAEDGNSSVDEKIAGLLRIKLGGSAAAKPKKAAKKKTVKKKAVKKTAKKAKKEEKPEEKKAKPEKAKKAEASEKPSEEEDKKKAEKGPEEGAEPKEAKKKKEKAEKKAGKDKKSQLPPKLREITIVKRAKPSEAEVVEEKPVKDMVEDLKKERSRPAKARSEKKLKKSERSKKAAEEASAKAKERPAFAKLKKWTKMKRTGKYPGKSSSAPQTAERKTPQKLEVHFPVNIRTLAPMMSKKPNELLQYVMGKGAFININQDLDEEVVRDMLKNFGFELEVAETMESIEKELVEEHDEETLVSEEKEGKESRAPIVTFMGHVDHGKTSLLDYIRNTMVTKGEKGGITQHIGAYRVETEKGAVAFLDTPGHAAFTAMRARGANATDVVVLVVAADDGVMPQTKEAIDHARAAEVPIVVAINKCDLPGANPDRVKNELQTEGLAAEDWGGDTVMVEVSAVTGEGVGNLVEMLMLESELLELKCNPNVRARGVVIEGKKTQGQGIVATFLVQNGTLKQGDIVFTGSFYGKVKAMINDRGERVNEAGPATPVEILGLQGVPVAGDEFFVVKDEKKARTLAALKQDAARHKKMAGSQRVTLEDLHSQIQSGDVKELKVILKADVQGSVEAIQTSLEDLSTEEVKLKVIHGATGSVNESDVMLAMVSSAVIIGFHTKKDVKAEELAKSEKIDIRMYDVIYEAIADVKAAMEGLLEPEEKEVVQGAAQVREVFSTRNGNVAGCMVTKGTIHRKDRIRVKRGQEAVFEGTINSLKRFKDDVRDVREGFECGISINGYNGIKKNDIIEAYIIEKVARRLEK
ncbi:MAG: translation initiation factor IF-2 [Candidatus Omnitrophica bacterium]|nr:translation initiation factor IF-2 [Candidatus Omnitrophota bacterium]